MNEKFFDLKQEKQDRMINGCLKVFAQSDYSHAGTDEMVREAGISKGLLFHYFGSKAGVYSFVFDYAVRYLIMELEAVKGRRITDPFLLLKECQHIVFGVSKGYPYLQLFLMRAAAEKNPEALEASIAQRQRLQNLMRELSMMVDFSGLQEELSGAHFWKLADYLTFGFLEERLGREEIVLDEIYKDYMSTLSAFYMAIKKEG